jgi:hypothetical protein
MHVCTGNNQDTIYKLQMPQEFQITIKEFVSVPGPNRRKRKANQEAKDRDSKKFSSQQRDHNLT